MNKLFKIIFSSFVAVFLIFLGVGYATVSLDFEIEHNVVGDAQEGVFITLAEQGASSGKVNSSSFLGTLLTSDIILNSTGSEVTMQITIHNNNTEPYCFIGTTYNNGLGYDNENIKYELSFTEGEWDTSKDDTSVIETNDSLTFNITFYHTGNGSNLSLNSVIDFMFIPLSKAHKVTVIHQGNTYIDAIPYEETVATFPENDFAFNQDIDATTEENNVARCNNNALPEFDSNTRKITVTEVYSSYYQSSQPKKVNNENNDVKCKIYNSLNLAIGDKNFEISNYTINNFLVLNNVDDTGETAYVPENKQFNVDLNEKTITYNSGGTMIIMNEASTLNINGDGTTKIEGGPNCDTLFEVDHKSAVLNITGGYYENQSWGKVMYPKQGKTIIRDSVLYGPHCNIFKIGLEPSKEADTSLSYNVHVEMIGGKAHSVEANVVHSTSRKTVLFSFVNVELIAGDTVILCNNKGVEESPPTHTINTWRNVKFYMTGGSIYGAKHDFATTGARLYYTNTVNGTGSLRASALGLVADKNAPLEYFAIKNQTDLVTEDWFYIKDTDGKRVKDFQGKDLKVGSPIEIDSTINTNTVLSVRDVNNETYLSELNGKGVIVWGRETEADRQVGQTFTLLRQSDNMYLLVMMYIPKYGVHFDKTHVVSGNSRHCKLYDVSSIHDGFYFKIEKMETGYSFVSNKAADNSIQALYLNVYVDVNNNKIVVGWDEKNGNPSQVWTFRIRNANVYY